MESKEEETPLFSPFFSTNLKSSIDSKSFQLRPLLSGDYERGHCSVLTNLTKVGSVSKQQWLQRFEEMRRFSETYFVIVIVETMTNRVVASGTLFIEKKFIRNTGLCGHIEDIVVDKDFRKRDFGLIIIRQLIQLGEQVGCYKIILDCSEQNVPFYEKCGFVKKELQMVRYTPPPKSKL